MAETAEVVIVGAGVMGASIAFHLAERGAGRILVLLTLFAGVQVGILSAVVLFMLPALAFVCLQFEVLAASIYAGSRNILVLGIIDAAWLAMVTDAIMPIRI